MKKILLIDTIHEIFNQGLEELGYTCIDGTQLSKQEILDIIPQFTGMEIRSRITIDKEILDRATSLKFIARAGAGMESIDEDYAKSKGIICLNAPEGNRNAVAEHAIAMLLSLFNNLIIADKEVRNGNWSRETNRGTELNGKTIGIIGYGNMGSAFAQCLKGFNVKVLAYDKYRKKYSDLYAIESSMDEIFDQADILSLHVPLTKETTFLVSTEFINRFKKDIYLVNTARGKIVKTDDLIENLKSGKIKGACLDVLEYESHSFENFSQKEIPASLDYLLKSNKVILSPHIAGWTFESYKKIAQVLIEKIQLLNNIHA